MRAVPRCRKPVGEGAIRVRILLMSDSLQTTRQIGGDVIDMVQAHGHANQALANAGRLTLHFRQAAVRGAGRMRRQRFGIAKVGAQREHLQLVEHVKVAQDVAKVLLVVMKRQGGQAQFSQLSQLQMQDSGLTLSWRGGQQMQQQQLETLLASYRKEQQDYIQTQLAGTQQQQASQLILLKDYLTEQQTKERRTDMLELVEYLNQQRQSDWHYWQDNYQPSQARLDLGASPNTQNR